MIEMSLLPCNHKRILLLPIALVALASLTKPINEGVCQWKWQARWCLAMTMQKTVDPLAMSAYITIVITYIQVFEIG